MALIGFKRSGRFALALWAGGLMVVSSALAAAPSTNAQKDAQKPGEHPPAAKAAASNDAKKSKSENKAKADNADAKSKPDAKAASQAKAKPELPLTRGASFDIDRTVIWLGGTQVISFHADKAAKTDRRFAASVARDDVLEVVEPATVLAGRRIGFVRVRGLRAGKTMLRIGGAPLKIVVKEDSIHDHVIHAAPIIVSPAPQAVVWGRFDLAVQLFEDPVQQLGLEPREFDASQSTSAQAAHAGAKVTLRVSNGQRLEPVSQTTAQRGPIRHFTFTLDTTKIKPGPISITAVAQLPGRTPRHSRSITLYVVHPDKADLVQGQAEALRNVPRPSRYVSRKRKEAGEPQLPLRVRKDKTASGGRYVDNRNARPPLTIPVHVKTPGWYQLMLRVAGDQGGGALPTVGVRIDNDFRATTATRLASADWHRLPIGHPVRLKAGDHSLIAYYENDFYAPHHNDRNLRIDRYALLRLDHRPTGGQAVIDRADDPRLAVAIDQNLNGQTLAGEVTLTGAVAWDKHVWKDPPSTCVLVNGKAVQAQRTASPEFRIARGLLKPGRNTLQLEARFDSGPVAKSPVQTVTLASFKAGESAPQIQKILHYSVIDSAWGDTLTDKLMHDRKQPGRVAEFASNGDGLLTLPDDLTGKFHIAITARGDVFRGAPIAKVTLLTKPDLSESSSEGPDGNDKSAEPSTHETSVGEVKVHGGGYRSWNVGTVDLPAGAKQLRVAFTNDLFDQKSKKRDRNLYLAQVVLTRAVPADHAAPTAAIVYPESGQEVYGQDAVVVDVADNRAVAWAQLMLDGQAMGVRIAPTNGEARILLPLVLRGVPAGAHKLTVRVRDKAGNTADSQADTVTVLKAPPAKPNRYERAVRLLDRFAYGPQPSELAAVLTMGEQAYLKDRLYRTWDDPGEQTAWAGALIRYPNDAGNRQVVDRALDYVITSPDPVRARFVMWASNHFSTWIRKIRAPREADNFERLARIGPAPFFDLLLTSAKSPGMLYYLDQERSFGKRINENYAREIMELHSLGVTSGYTQTDVTQFSYILTGWFLADQARLDGGGQYLQSTFQFVPSLNDPAPRTVFGMRFDAAPNPAGRYDRVRKAIEMLASRPKNALFISRKLADHYLAMPASDKVVQTLAQVYRKSGGDLRQVLLAIARQPEFFSPDYQYRVARPIDFAISLMRMTDDDNVNVVASYLNRSALGLFDHEQPNGYPEADQAYTDSNVTLRRWQLIGRMTRPLADLVPGPLTDPPAARKDVKGGGVSKVDKTTHDAAVDTWRQRVIDVAAVRLTGRLLSPESNDAAVKLLKETKLTGNDRIRLITSVIAQMPETSLR